MSNDKMLKQILKDESLKEKYWKGVNIDNENTATASNHKNNSIRVLATLLNVDTSDKNKINNIKNIYNL